MMTRPGETDSFWPADVKGNDGQRFRRKERLVVFLEMQLQNTSTKCGTVAAVAERITGRDALSRIELLELLPWSSVCHILACAGAV